MTVDVQQYSIVRARAKLMAQEHGVVHYVIETKYGLQVVAELNGRRGVVACYPDGSVQYFD